MKVQQRMLLLTTTMEICYQTAKTMAQSSKQTITIRSGAIIIETTFSVGGRLCNVYGR